MKFSDYRLAPEIRKSLDKLGFKRPTDIQYRAIPHIMKGEDVMAVAQTGTGKTAAFAIPIINKIHSTKRTKKSGEIRCLVMVPTRELALQITEVFQQIGKHSKVKTMTVHGGVGQDPQIDRLEEGIDILIATPGRMFDLMSQGFLNLREVQILVLDEADHMLDLGFKKDIEDLMRKIPAKRQTLFFSATINETVKKLAYETVSRAIRIQISPKDPVAKNIDHGVAFVKMDDKRFFLERIIRENPDTKMLVFVRTKVRAERVKKALERVEIESETIHSDREQADRTTVMQKFRVGEIQILIATDISARGIDIANVDQVINYDLPDVAENYVHRVGRTGRGTHRGKAISFCSEEERPMLEEIQEYLANEIKVLDISSSDYADTIDLSEETSGDWKTLMKKAEQDEIERTRKKNKRKKKK